MRSHPADSNYTHIRGTGRSDSLFFNSQDPTFCHNHPVVFSMSTSIAESSRHASKACTFDLKTIYVHASMDPTFKFKAASQNPPTGDDEESDKEDAMSNVTVYVPFEDRRRFQKIEDGTGKRLTQIGHTTFNETKSMVVTETGREPQQHDDAAPDYNASLLSALRKSKYKKFGGETYDVKVLSGPVPSQSEFEDKGFTKVLPKELVTLMHGFDEQGRRVEGASQRATQTASRGRARRVAPADDKHIGIVDEDWYKKWGDQV